MGLLAPKPRMVLKLFVCICTGSMMIIPSEFFCVPPPFSLGLIVRLKPPVRIAPLLILTQTSDEGEPWASYGANAIHHIFHHRFEIGKDGMSRCDVVLIEIQRKATPGFQLETYSPRTHLST